MRHILARHTFTADDWHRLGWDRLQQKDLAGAVSCFRSAVALARQFAAGWYDLAWAMDELGGTTEATAALRHAVASAPERPEARLYLVRLLMRQGLEVEAFQVWWEGQKRRR